MRKYYFEKLEVWNDSIQFVKSIYEITKTFPKTEIYGIISQIRRAAVSIPTNIAEGVSRMSFKEQARFTTISYSSLMETLNLIIISKENGFLEEHNYLSLRENIDKISNKLNSLRKSQINRTV